MYESKKESDNSWLVKVEDINKDTLISEITKIENSLNSPEIKKYYYFITDYRLHVENKEEKINYIDLLLKEIENASPRYIEHLVNVEQSDGTYKEEIYKIEVKKEPLKRKKASKKYKIRVSIYELRPVKDYKELLAFWSTHLKTDVDILDKRKASYRSKTQSYSKKDVEFGITQGETKSPTDNRWIIEDTYLIYENNLFFIVKDDGEFLNRSDNFNIVSWDDKTKKTISIKDSNISRLNMALKEETYIFEDDFIILLEDSANKHYVSLIVNLKEDLDISMWLKDERDKIELSVASFLGSEKGFSQDRESINDIMSVDDYISFLEAASKTEKVEEIKETIKKLTPIRQKLLETFNDER